MGRLQLLIVVAAIGVWSCRGGSAAKACGKSSKATHSIDHLPPPPMPAPRVKPAVKPAVGAAAADDFAAPVDSVGKAAVIDDAADPAVGKAATGEGGSVVEEAAGTAVDLAGEAAGNLGGDDDDD